MTDVVSQKAWFTEPGEATDVVVSTRSRLARNLCNFQFPRTLKTEDFGRVEAVVFDAFNQIGGGEKYQCFKLKNIEPLGRQILVERAVLSPDMLNLLNTGAVVRDDGHITCTVNRKDHVHLASLASGFSPHETYSKCHAVDLELQKHLQYAGDLDIGYYTSCFKDCGTGLKMSVMLHLPSIVQADLQMKLFSTLGEQGFDIFAVFATSPIVHARALGSWYRIATASTWPASETDQIAQVVSAGQNIIEIERRTREDLRKNMPTFIRDRVYRALAAVKFGRYVSFQEGIELVSTLKWGFDLGLIEGLDDTDCFALLNRIQTAQLAFVIRTGSFSFEEDVKAEEQQIERLRSLILQEAAANIELV